MFDLKTKLLTLLSLMVLGLSFVSTPLAYAADSKGDICKGAGLIGGSTDCSTSGGPTVQGVVRTGINFFSVIVGLISVVMIIVAGVKFVTSGGSTEKVTAAKNTVLYAVIGLVIVALAQVIVRFVLSKASKAT